ncbi:MAG: hypothetical protein LBS90_05965 [Oscillospiraceae bacterium]|jgi:hypothetical protein|nr:hypothetical protein [Oscillospiraceae bacterium]
MNDRERDASIDLILSRGLVKPKSAAAVTREMLRGLGLRFIFWDTAYSIIFAVLTLAPIAAVLLITPTERHFTVAFALSPALFLLITAFAETAERAGALYELKRTCRYTVRQITALRIACYSLAGVVYCAAVTAVSANSGAELVRLLTLCLGSLFVCAAASLAVMRNLRRRWVNAVFAAAWLFANTALPARYGAEWETLLSGVPYAVSAAAAAAGIAALILQLKSMLTEALPYADA